MLTRRVIPCLDVRDGKVVKGVRFRDHVIMGEAELSRTALNGSPRCRAPGQRTAGPAPRTRDGSWESWNCAC
jgi:imidazole glycerol-phosphate synthase subunit HisF